jgi:hypothetical protein
MPTKNKTTQTEVSVKDFINKGADEQKRKDSFEIVKIMESQTGFKAKMWGPSIIGFGVYHYKYETGREGDAPLVAFSPRKAAIALYLGCEVEKKEKFLEKLGKYKGDKGCIYIKKLSDINTDVLKELIDASVKYYKDKYK